MGLASARLLAAEGAKVIITGRREKDLDAAVKLIGPSALGVQGDVSKMADLDRLVAIIKEKLGHLDIIFANAGYGQLKPLGLVTEEEFDAQFATNVKGVFFTVQKALPLLRDGASIILNSSVAAYKGMEAFSVYSATKAAVRSFARTWTNDLKSRKIRVNSLSPGPIDTPYPRQSRRLYRRTGQRLEGKPEKQCSAGPHRPERRNRQNGSLPGFR